MTVNHDYFGASEETVGSPANTGHAAAAELVSSNHAYPPLEQFAIAWVRRSDQHVMVRRYATGTAPPGFLGPEVEMSPWPSPAWVRHMGFDEDCLTETGTVQSCAWFVFDDIYGWVNWRAVGANGTMSMNHSVQGQHGSGDSASVCTVWFQDRCLQWTRKKLLAWITSATERTQVKARLLDDAGNQIGSDLVLANAQPGRKFYQTAVAFSGNENRWLVVWTDAGTTTGQPVGHAFTTYVRFDGTASGTVNTVGPCDEYDKSAVETEAASRNGTRWNDYLACKGIWLASSWYSTTTDRYRFHNYGFHRRIDSNGTPAAQWSNLGCHVYCPMTEASFSYDGVPTTFQMLSNSVNMPDRSVHFRLRRDSYEKYDFNTTVMDYPWFIPQAFRSNAYVAAALSTDRDRWTTGNVDLVLSIVDVRYDTLVCPPAP